MPRQLVHLMVLFGIALFLEAAPARGQGGNPVRGQKLFKGLGCQTCHTVRGVGGPGGLTGGGETKAPDLALAPEGGPFYGSMVEMGDGQKVEVTEDYLLQSIMKPAALVVKDPETGRPYPADKMPTRFTHLPKRDLDSLVAYIKSLSGVGPEPITASTVEHAPLERAMSKAPVWVWGFVGCFGCVITLASVRGMSRNISWQWITLIAAIPAVGLVTGVVTAHHSVGGAEREFNITARQFAYEPSIIRVNRGDKVTISLKSVDVLHGFYVDGYGIDQDIRPNETVRLTFVANKPGKFPFRCSNTCGVFHPFMIGNLIVTPNYLFPGSIGLCFGLGLATFVYTAKKDEE